MCIECQDENGNWIPATPEPLRCEIDNCPETEGDWYIRNTENKDGSDWDTEPVYLCKKHGANHKLYKEKRNPINIFMKFLFGNKNQNKE